MKATSDLKTADAAIKASAGVLRGVALITDGTNLGTVVIYDNASAASGTVLFKMSASGASGGREAMNLDIPASTGIYADVSGTGAGYIVYYQ